MSNGAPTTKRLAKSRRSSWRPPPLDLQRGPLTTIYPGKPKRRGCLDAFGQNPRGGSSKRTKDPPRNLRPPQPHRAAAGREFHVATSGARVDQYITSTPVGNDALMGQSPESKEDTTRTLPHRPSRSGGRAWSAPDPGNDEGMQKVSENDHQYNLCRGAASTPMRTEV